MPLEKAWKRISEYYRRMKTEMLYFLVCYLFLIGCNGKSNKENYADVTDTIFEEANEYRASISDTTFLRTRGIMSYAAIDMYT